MNPKNYIKSKLEKKVTVKRMLKVSLTAMVLAMGVSTYLHFTIVPTWVLAAEEMMSAGDVIVVSEPVVVEQAATEDRLERYYAEYYEVNSEEFESHRSDDAMAKAIERVETDLEVEKEKLRTKEVFQ